jgi:hypothetical protein
MVFFHLSEESPEHHPVVINGVNAQREIYGAATRVPVVPAIAIPVENMRLSLSIISSRVDCLKVIEPPVPSKLRNAWTSVAY